MKAALSAALPKHIKVDKFIRVTLAALQSSPKVFECSQESILLSLMRAASYGLEPDGGVLGHGYLVPFWNSKARRMDCQFIPGYRGLVKLARNSGEVADVWAEVVYEADRFEYELGLEQTMKHKRNDEAVDVGPLKYAYAVARFRDGNVRFVVMNRREIEDIKSKTASRDREGNAFGPWVDHEPEMWKKTAVRRLAKMLPLSPDVAMAMDSEDREDNTLESFGLVVPSHDALTPPTPEDDSPGDTTETVDKGSLLDSIRSAASQLTTVEEVNRCRKGWADDISDVDTLDAMDLICNQRIKELKG